MNTTEINGFEIETFNQYDLKAGAKESHCPLCSHDRSSVNQKQKCASLDWSRGLGTCHHCGEVFQLHTFKSKTMKEYVKPKWVNNTFISDKAIKYFESRGISQKSLVDLKVGEGLEWMPQTKKEVNTIQFHFFEDGKLINTKFRDGKKNFKLVSGAQRIFYNIDSVNDSEYVVIVEGEIDAISVHEVGLTSVISVPTGANVNTNNLDFLDWSIDKFDDKQKIILALDNDEAGQALQQEFIRRLGAEVCYLADFGSYKDANGYLVANGSVKLHDLLSSAPQCPLENVVTLKDVNDELEDFVYNGFKPGFQVGLPNFDNIFSTYTGQFIAVTGIPSSGKSDFVDQMAVGYNQRYGWKIAFASPENKPTFLHTHKLIRKIGNWMPSRTDVRGPKWNEIVEHIDNNYFFLEMERYDLDKVLEKASELVKRKGIKCFVLDPFNKINMKGKSNMNVNDYTMEYLKKIEEFCRKYDVLTIVVAHPTKMYKNQQGLIDEPTMYNIKGGGEWYDASHHGLLVHRNYEEKTVKVKVLKVKFQNLGENGAEQHFKWNHRSGTYDELESPTKTDMPF